MKTVYVIESRPRGSNRKEHWEPAESMPNSTVIFHRDDRSATRRMRFLEQAFPEMQFRLVSFGRNVGSPNPKYRFKMRVRQAADPDDFVP